MYHSSSIVKNVDIKNDTFDIVNMNGEVVHTISNRNVKDINSNSNNTEIRIVFKHQLEQIVLVGFGDIQNFTNCLIVLKKTSSSLRNKHYVDILNYSESLIGKTDYYHYFNPDTFIYRVDSNKNEITCKDTKNQVSVILHPNPVTIIKRKVNILYVVNGVTDENTIFKFLSEVDAVKGLENLLDAFKALETYCDRDSEGVCTHIQTVPSKDWVVFYGDTPLAAHDNFSVTIWDDNGYLTSGVVRKEPVNNIVRVSFDVEMTGKVQLIK